MSVTITRILVEGIASNPNQAVTITDQATGIIIGSGSADGTGAFTIPVQYGTMLSGTAAGSSWTQGVLFEGQQSGAAGGVAAVSGTLTQALPLGGSAGGVATAGPSEPVVNPGLGGTAGGTASPSGTLQGGNLPLAGTAAGVAAPTSSGLTVTEAPAGFVDAFNNSSIDSTNWNVLTGGGGSATETTKLVLSANHDEGEGIYQAAAVAYKTGFTRATSKTIKIDFDVNADSASGDDRLAHIGYRATVPAAAGSAGTLFAQCIYFRVGSSIEMRYLDGGGSDSQASTTYSASLGTTYRFVFESNATQWRGRLMSVDENTTHKDFGWINWSATQGGTDPLWLIIGDPWTDYGGINADVYRAEVA